MKIECPHCKEQNEIEFAENIKCHKCGKSFKDYNFRKSHKFAISAVSALAFGGIGGYHLNGYFSDRYPVRVEYAIVDTCVNGAGNRIEEYLYRHKRELCSCALEKTMPKVSLSELKSDPAKFGKVFRDEEQKCRDKK